MRVVDSPFDSAHLAVRVGRLELAPADDAAAVRRVMADAREAGFDVVFVRVLDGSRGHALLRALGHAPVDELVTSLRPATLGAPAGSSPRVRFHRALAEARDVAAVHRITTESMTRSHFHADPRLGLDRARALYAAWAVNDVTGRAQGVFVVREAEAVVGFITILERGDRVVLDLVAMDVAFQGRGYGRELLDACCAWIAGAGRDASVGTQRDNPALRLYRRAGFEPVETHLTYHLWLRPERVTDGERAGDHGPA